MWKSVPGYDDEYEVSAVGEFRRLTTRSGRSFSEPRLVKTGSRKGYRNVTFCKEGNIQTYAAHRVVWEAFNGFIPDGIQINHKNGNKADNNLANLELATPSENTRHAFTHLGRKPVKNPNPGERNGRAKLSDADIPAIFAARAQGLSQQKIADRFGVSQVSISRVLLGKSFKIS